MSKLLEQVITEVEKLPESEQDDWAEWLLDELKSERRWDKVFAQSGVQLEKLADEALSENR
jgi:hypothetical protein